MAEDYHDNYDGWELTFPIKLTILNNGNGVASFTIEREYVAVFTARGIYDEE